MTTTSCDVLEQHWLGPNRDVYVMLPGERIDGTALALAQNTIGGLSLVDMVTGVPQRFCEYADVEQFLMDGIWFRSAKPRDPGVFLPNQGVIDRELEEASL